MRLKQLVPHCMAFMAILSLGALFALDACTASGDVVDDVGVVIFVGIYDGFLSFYERHVAVVEDIVNNLHLVERATCPGVLLRRTPGQYCHQQK